MSARRMFRDSLIVKGLWVECLWGASVRGIAHRKREWRVLGGIPGCVGTALSPLLPWGKCVPAVIIAYIEGSSPIHVLLELGCISLADSDTKKKYGEERTLCKLNHARTLGPCAVK